MNYRTPNYAIAASVTKSTGGKIGSILSDWCYSNGTWNWSLKKSCTFSDLLPPPTVTCSYGGPETKPTFSSSRIIDGYVATAYSWPWLVTLFYKDNLLCGGFLAASYQFVITAAHCVEPFTTNSIRVYVGLQTLSSHTNAQFRDILLWRIQPNYSPKTFLNNIAVLKLTSQFDVLFTTRCYFVTYYK